jgi:hypothetical protein
MILNDGCTKFAAAGGLTAPSPGRSRRSAPLMWARSIMPLVWTTPDRRCVGYRRPISKKGLISLVTTM